MRKYSDLATLLSNEASVPDSENAAKKLIVGLGEDNPNFEYLVLFVEPLDSNANYWVMVPVPSDGIENIEKAEICNLADGRHPVAYWKRKPNLSA